MKPLKVYICDLTHETVILVSDTVPINIGYVGSYAKKIHRDLRNEFVEKTKGMKKTQREEIYKQYLK